MLRPLSILYSIFSHAYLLYLSSAEAQHALKTLNRHIIRGKPVYLSVPSENKRESAITVHVGNLSFKTTEKDLSVAFPKAVKVSIVRPKANRLTGYVIYRTQEGTLFFLKEC